jgi:hypothetical protein
MERLLGEFALIALLSIVMAMIAPNIFTAALLGFFITGPIVILVSNMVWGRRVRKEANKDASL